MCVCVCVGLPLSLNMPACKSVALFLLVLDHLLTAIQESHDMNYNKTKFHYWQLGVLHKINELYYC